MLCCIQCTHLFCILSFCLRSTCHNQGSCWTESATVRLHTGKLYTIIAGRTGSAVLYHCISSFAFSQQHQLLAKCLASAACDACVSVQRLTLTGLYLILVIADCSTCDPIASSASRVTAGMIILFCTPARLLQHMNETHGFGWERCCPRCT